MKIEFEGDAHTLSARRAASGRARAALVTAATAIMFGLAAPSAVAAADCTIPTTLGVAFSIDDSGSMSTSDPERLRSAATGAGIDQLPDGAYAAVSSFDSSSRSLFDPVVVTDTNRAALKDDVDNSLYAGGETYYDLAFSRAKLQLDAMPGADKRALVFLSDGAPNGGDYEYELGEIRRAGFPVFAIGFGSAPGSVLAEIAASTGGQAYTIQSPGEAQAVFARIVSTLTCDAAQVRANVSLSPGETRSFPYAIGAADREFRALATWEYGDVSVRLRRPDGSLLAPGAEIAGERFISEDTYASVIGRNPAVGGWEMQVTASPDNYDQVDVSIDIFRRTSADPPDTFALVAPAGGAQIPLGPATFSWVGARNAAGYELEIDDRVVASGLPRDATSVTINLLGAAGQHTWRVAAVNQFGRTLSERRGYVRTGYKYVALGDSFSSGEGVEPFFEPGNACHRSTLAYATRVRRPAIAGKKQPTIYSTRARPEVEWGFQACSGAQTDNVTVKDAAHGGDPLSQLERERAADTPAINANDLPVDENTDLVTITIGGNDMGFADVLQACAFSKNCTTEKYDNLCTPGGEKVLMSQNLRCRRDALSPKLDEVYRLIHEQAPGARILAIGYPQLFPKQKDDQDCRQLKRPVGVGRVSFANTEQNYLRQATSELNQLIAARAEASGAARFVAVDDYFDGHEICAAEEWVHPLALSGVTVAARSFHPNQAGQKDGYGVAINDALSPGPAPTMHLASSAPSVVRPTGDGRVTLSRRQVACPAGPPACTITTDVRADLTAGARSAAATAATATRIGGSRITVLPRHRKTLRIALTRKGLATLRKRKRIRAKLSIVAVHGNNRVRTRTISLLLVAPKRAAR